MVPAKPARGSVRSRSRSKSEERLAGMDVTNPALQDMPLGSLAAVPSLDELGGLREFDDEIVAPTPARFWTPKVCAILVAVSIIGVLAGIPLGHLLYAAWY